MGARVLLADDEVVLRQALKVFLERQGFTVVGEASDGPQTLELTRKHHPDLVLLEVNLPRTGGLRVAREIIRANPSIGVVLLTRLLDDRYIVEALRARVRGFVLKNQPLDDLLQALREVARGGVYLGPSASPAVVEASRDFRALPQRTLSSREREVLQLVAQGKTTKQIAGLLSISHKTAGFHRSRLMKKLNIHDTAGLVRYAIRHGLIAP